MHNEGRGQRDESPAHDSIVWVMHDWVMHTKVKVLDAWAAYIYANWLYSISSANAIIYVYLYIILCLRHSYFFLLNPNAIFLYPNATTTTIRVFAIACLKCGFTTLRLRLLRAKEFMLSLAAAGPPQQQRQRDRPLSLSPKSSGTTATYAHGFNANTQPNQPTNQPTDHTYACSRTTAHARLSQIV